MDDVFCRIIRKEVPAHIVYESDEALALLDITPSAPGHTVVVSKKHGSNISDYTQEELGIIMKSVQDVAGKIEKALNPDSITIGINHKEKRGIPHLHIHLIPRWESDHGHALQGVVQNKPKESLEIIREKIRNS